MKIVDTKWEDKAHGWYIKHRLDGPEVVDKIAHGLKHGHMFRKLWKMMMKADICPWDMCLTDEKLEAKWGCPCKNGDTKKCWPRLRKELER